MSLATRRRRRVGSQGRGRSYNLSVNGRTLCQLSYLGIIGGPTGNRTQRELLARHLSAPAAGPWCPALDSNQPLRAFNARQSPDLLTGRLERPAGNDPASQPWQGCTLPLSYSRMVGSRRNRTSCHKGTAFTAQRRHQPALIGTPRVAEDGNRTHCAFRRELMRLTSARCLSPHKGCEA
jgi:hypothetical protein